MICGMKDGVFPGTAADSTRVRDLTRAGLLGLGAIVGAQVGAAAGQRLTDKTRSRLLSAGLVAIGGGLILAPVF